MGYWIFVAMRDVSMGALKKFWFMFAEDYEGQAMGGQGILSGRNPLKDAAWGWESEAFTEQLRIYNQRLLD